MLTPRQMEEAKKIEFQKRFGKNAQLFRQPPKEIRDRQRSQYLQFMNYQEIHDSHEKLKDFDGRIVEKPLDSFLEKPKKPISDARTNMPRERNDFFGKSTEIISSK